MNEQSRKTKLGVVGSSGTRQNFLFDAFLAKSTTLPLVAFLVLLVTASDANADGGKVQLSQVANERRLTVFTSPTPLVCGPVDVSFLVQDKAGGQVAREAQVKVIFEHVESGQSIEKLANFFDSTNKMLQSTETQLTRPGQWNLHISVDSGEFVNIPVYLSEPNPIGSWIAGIILAPLVFMGLYLLRERIVAKNR